MRVEKDSELHFSRTELEQLLSTHDPDGARRELRSEAIDAAWEHGRVAPEADASLAPG